MGAFSLIVVINLLNRFVMPLTCLACRTVFPSSEQQRNHYQTEWHRYNLKRKIVELHPVSQEEFELKRLAAEKQKAVTTNNRGARRTSVPTEEFDPDRQQLRYVVCNKNFQSTKAITTHLKSNRHLVKEKGQQNPTQFSRQTSVESSSSVLSSQLAAEINANSECVQIVSKTQRIGSEMDIDTPLSFFDNEDDEEWESDEGEDDEWDECYMEEDGNEDDEEMEVDDSEQKRLEEQRERRAKMKASLNPKKCLFCIEGRVLGSIDECLQHMQQCHTFFIPYSHLVSDVEKLLTYLQYKVEILRQCVLCSKRSKHFGVGTDVRRHMYDKGHNRMAYETPEQFLEYVAFYNEPEDAVDATNDDPTGEKLEELLSLALEDQYSLVLPSGAVIGHRCLMKYYKQKPRIYSEALDLKRIKDSTRRYVGFRSNQQNNAIELSRNIPPIKELKVLQKFKTKHMAKLQLKQNSLKTHSRDEHFWNMRY